MCMSWKAKAVLINNSYRFAVVLEFMIVGVLKVYIILCLLFIIYQPILKFLEYNLALILNPICFGS